jgi:hypothetical protein
MEVAMRQESANAAAERLSSKRARALPWLSVLFIAQQASYFLGTGAGTGDLPIHNVQIISWLALSSVMLLVLATGGGWSYSRQARELANDESTRAHRDAALRIGFLASMATCIVVYVISLGVPLPGQDAVHMVMTAGIATALVRFALLERRALKDA